MNNFSDRISNLKKFFGVKEIVEDSILSDFKNKDPKNVVTACSSESKKEIDKAKESIPEVNKNEGIESIFKEFAESIGSKTVTKEEIENAENEAVLAEMKARKAQAERNTREAKSDLVNPEPKEFSTEIPVTELDNFAEDKNKKDSNALDSALDDDYYNTFNKYLKKATTGDHFNNFRNAANDVGYRNRLLKDTEFIKEFESGLDIKDEKKKQDIIKYRKAFITEIKNLKGKSDKINEESSKSALDGYVSDSSAKGKNAKRMEISIKRGLLTPSQRSNALHVLVAHPAMTDLILKDDSFKKELESHKLAVKKNFATDDENKNKESNKSEEKTWMEFKDVDGLDNKELISKLDSKFKEFKSNWEDSNKDKKFEDEVINKDLEEIEKIDKGNAFDFIKDEKIEGDKNIGGMYLSPEDQKKQLDEKSKAIAEANEDNSIGIGIKTYVQNKISKDKKDKKELTKEEQNLSKEEEKVRKVGKIGMAGTYAKNMLAGMEEPGLSFCKGIIDMIVNKSAEKQLDAGTEMTEIVDKAKDASKDLPKDLEIKDDDITIGDELSEDDKKIVDKAIEDVSDIKEEELVKDAEELKLSDSEDKLTEKDIGKLIEAHEELKDLFKKPKVDKDKQSIIDKFWKKRIKIYLDASNDKDKSVLLKLIEFDKDLKDKSPKPFEWYGKFIRGSKSIVKVTDNESKSDESKSNESKDIGTAKDTKVEQPSEKSSELGKTGTEDKNFSSRYDFSDHMLGETKVDSSDEYGNILNDLISE